MKHVRIPKTQVIQYAQPADSRQNRDIMYTETECRISL